MAHRTWNYSSLISLNHFEISKSIIVRRINSNLVHFCNQNEFVHQEICGILDIEIELVDYKLDKNGWP